MIKIGILILVLCGVIGLSFYIRSIFNKNMTEPGSSTWALIKESSLVFSFSIKSLTNSLSEDEEVLMPKLIQRHLEAEIIKGYKGDLGIDSNTFEVDTSFFFGDVLRRPTGILVDREPKVGDVFVAFCSVKEGVGAIEAFQYHKAQCRLINYEEVKNELR